MFNWNKPLTRTLVRTILGSFVLSFASVAMADKIRVAFGDVLNDESLAMAIAFERAKARGVDYEITYFSKENLAIQSVINGQADIGIGTPYSVIQKSKAPLRIVFQATRLVFFPVVDKKYKSWKDLDGQPFTFHARGTGTEAIGNIIAKREGIKFGDRSYVPGSQNRIVAMMKGQINATIIDLANKNILMSKAGDRFHILPGVSNPASDETVFAKLDFIKKNEAKIDIIVSEFYKLWNEMQINPGIIDSERKKFKMMADQPKEVLAEITSFYKTSTKEGIYSPLGGGEDVAKSDFEFYTEAGQMTGPISSLKVSDFWYLSPLNKARKAAGK